MSGPDIKPVPEGKVSLELQVKAAKVLQKALQRVKAGEVEFLCCILLYTDKNISRWYVAGNNIRYTEMVGAVARMQRHVEDVAEAAGHLNFDDEAWESVEDTEEEEEEPDDDNKPA